MSRVIAFCAATQRHGLLAKQHDRVGAERNLALLDMADAHRALTPEEREGCPWHEFLYGRQPEASAETRSALTEWLRNDASDAWLDAGEAAALARRALHCAPPRTTKAELARLRAVVDTREAAFRAAQERLDATELAHAAARSTT